jgi:hypothetical protein
MRTSEQINELATALAKAQAEMKNAKLNKVNPHFKSRYADLAEIRDTVTPSLSKNGIAVVHGMGAAESGITLNGLQVMDATGFLLPENDLLTMDFGAYGPATISGTNVSISVPFSSTPPPVT